MIAKNQHVDKKYWVTSIRIAVVRYNNNRIFILDIYLIIIRLSSYQKQMKIQKKRINSLNNYLPMIIT